MKYTIQKPGTAGFFFLLLHEEGSEHLSAIEYLRAFGHT